MGLATALILGSISMHTSTDYQPTNGYNENHMSLGAEVVLSDGDGFEPGASIFRFKDSFNKESRAVLVSYGYRYKAVKAGIATGYTKTSYYEGFVGMPFVEANYKRVGLQLGYIPKVPGVDSVLMLQGKVRF